MPRITFAENLAVGEVFDPMQASIYRYLPWPARVRVLAWATTVANFTPRFQALSGSELIQPETPVGVGMPAAGQLPTVFNVDPLDFAAPPGDLLQTIFRNAGAAAGDIAGIIDVNPA